MHVSLSWRGHAAVNDRYEYRVVFADGVTMNVISSDAAGAALDAEVIRCVSPEFLSLSCAIDRKLALTVLSVRMVRVETRMHVQHVVVAE